MVDYRDVLKSLDKIDITGEKVTKEDLARLRKIFGSRFSRGFKITKEGGVKKYIFKPSGRVVWIVVGKNRDYLIYSAVAYCSCDDFFFAVMEGKALVCHHFIAQRLAEKLGWYDRIEERDNLFDSLIKEWKRGDDQA